MSNTISAPIALGDVAWKQAADDVHVATRDGEFAGYVATDAGGSTLFNAHGATIGTFPTIAEATDALSAPVRTTRAPRFFRIRRRIRS